MAEHLVQLTQLDAGFKINICNSLWWSIEGGALPVMIVMVMVMVQLTLAEHIGRCTAKT